MTKRCVLALCNRTRNMVAPWLEAGYEAVTVDMQEADRIEPGRHHLVADVMSLSIQDVGRFKPSIVFAFPPCTDLAVSGARHFRDKGLPRLIKALQIVNACREICEALNAPYMIENPVSTLATYWREADHTFNPSDFALYADEPDGQAYLKRTCLWTGGGSLCPSPRQSNRFWEVRCGGCPRLPTEPILGPKHRLALPAPCLRPTIHFFNE